MSATEKQNEEKYLKDMRNYVSALKRKKSASDNKVCEEAKDALIRTGVLNKNGRPKKKIVNWE